MRETFISKWSVFTSLLFGAICTAAVAADTAPQPDKALDIYAKPDKLIDIGAGRRLNLRCSGKGTTTVILESGATADSLAWFKVQPLLAKFTSVCAYDRAGFGFSDGGPMPRNVDAAATDLHALLHAARIGTPVIMLGHSLGTNIVRRYAEQHPEDVSGLVLLDPPEQNIAEFSAALAKGDDEALPARLEFIRACEKGAEKGELANPPEELKRCLRGPDPTYSAKLNAAIHTYHSRPAFWQTLISVFETNAILLGQPVSPNENHAALPLLVLTADQTFADATAQEREAMEAARDKTHKQIVATSTRGERIFVEHSSHEIQVDRPDAVVDAVTKVMKQIKPDPATKDSR